jgi:hypothetical protein
MMMNKLKSLAFGLLLVVFTMSAVMSLDQLANMVMYNHGTPQPLLKEMQSSRVGEIVQSTGMLDLWKALPEEDKYEAHKRMTAHPEEKGRKIIEDLHARNAKSTMDMALLREQFKQLQITPTNDQEVAGLHLIQLQRSKFSEQDIFATVYLQTNKSRLKKPLLEPSLEEINAAKRLIELNLKITRKKLEATLHLQTNQGNALKTTILAPSAKEIKAAKSLKARADVFSTEQLHQECQSRKMKKGSKVSAQIIPKLQKLAEASKKLSIRHYDQGRSQAKDKEADRLIRAAPMGLRDGLRKEYELLKEQAMSTITEDDIEAGLVERRKIAAEVFG